MYGDWEPLIHAEKQEPYFLQLLEFLRTERHRHEIYPPEEETFTALQLTSLEATRVVIVGQDPYHDEQQAHGLAFSVKSGRTIPPSLRNIFKEMHTDLNVPMPTEGILTRWANQGVLLLNSTLTVRAHEAGSHRGHGWEIFTDHIIAAVNEKKDRCVFILWGASARKKKTLITNSQHVILESAHPSPLSAHQGFFGSRPFSRTNTALHEAQRGQIDWTLN